MRRTLIIFDYDDTILPTTWVTAHQGPYDLESIRGQLEGVSRSICKMFNKASRYGDLMLVTNAEFAWVEESCRLFLGDEVRRALPLRVVSRPLNVALENFKNDAFMNAVGTDRYDQIVSVGDGPWEWRACENLRRVQPSKTIKVVKFLETPSLEDLQDQLDQLTARLRDILEYPSRADLCFQVNPKANPRLQLFHFTVQKKEEARLKENAGKNDVPTVVKTESVPTPSKATGPTGRGTPTSSGSAAKKKEVPWKRVYGQWGPNGAPRAAGRV